jgi:hypothetical protein
MAFGDDPGMLEMLNVEDDEGHVEDEHPLHPLQGMRLLTA